jgi:hypothetical protein
MKRCPTSVTARGDNILRTIALPPTHVRQSPSPTRYLRITHVSGTSTCEVPPDPTHNPLQMHCREC